MMVRLGAVEIGEQRPPVFLPDIDVYFKHDEAEAFALIDRVAAAGLPLVKGAIILSAEVALDAPTEYWIAEGRRVSESYRAIMERHAMPADAFRRVYGRARERGLGIVLSVYDEEGIALAIELGAVALKSPSSNIVHAPLIRAIAATGLPMFIDTGRSTLEEIDRAVKWAREAGARDLIVQHSPPGPPAPARDFHLRMMTYLGQRHACLFGLSDHDVGTQSLSLAVALGAHVLEKGLCRDDAAPDIDIAHALPVGELPATIEMIQRTWDSLGNEVRVLPAGRARPNDRPGLIAREALAPGATLTLANVAFAFPTVGIPAEDWDRVAGGRLLRPVPAGAPIAWADVERN